MVTILLELTSEWLPGMKQGLRVLPLHDYAGESTAMVNWAPGSRFQRHVHPGGEEILVLEGTFSDEHGDYPAGTWLRNPPWSAHTPFSREGCTILVKVGHLSTENVPPNQIASR
jgi:anti-sigma factor ChrR (cupin superfamily)